MYKSATSSILKSSLVRRSVIRGITAENQSQGTDYFVGRLRFTQADFEAYDQYEECGRLLIRQLANGGSWSELIIHAPPGVTVRDD